MLQLLIVPLLMQTIFGSQQAAYAKQAKQDLANNVQKAIDSRKKTAQELQNILDNIQTTSQSQLETFNQSILDSTESITSNYNQLKVRHVQERQRLFIVSGISLMAIFFIFLLKISLKIIAFKKKNVS